MSGGTCKTASTVETWVPFEPACSARPTPTQDASAQSRDESSPRERRTCACALRVRTTRVDVGTNRRPASEVRACVVFRRRPTHDVGMDRRRGSGELVLGRGTTAEC